MKFLVFEKPEQADAFNNAEAITRGCSGVTTRWWSAIEHDDGRAALAVEYEGPEGVDPALYARLISATDMIQDGWSIENAEASSGVGGL